MHVLGGECLVDLLTLQTPEKKLRGVSVAPAIASVKVLCKLTQACAS